MLIEKGCFINWIHCRHMPSHASREVLALFGSLTTCDPGDILQTIKVHVLPDTKSYMMHY